jgi:GNAT superfamily N-acetyltransferase
MNFLVWVTAYNAGLDSTAMTSRARYTAKELTAATWRDFQALFAKHNGVWGGCWCMYGHGRTTFQIRGNADAHRQEKRKRVRGGTAHGVLLYERGTPIGSCQFGPRDELPRMDGGRFYRKLGVPEGERFWRITCFFVDRNHRKRGVASAALEAALAAIRRKGGGVVEAYPFTSAASSFTYSGTEAMFRRQGFAPIARLGKSQVVMRKSLPAK